MELLTNGPTRSIIEWRTEMCLKRNNTRPHREHREGETTQSASHDKETPNTCETARLWCASCGLPHSAAAQTLVLGQLFLGTLMLHRLQQSANLRIPSVDQAPKLDVPLFEVLAVAVEDLQVLAPVKVVPLPASFGTTIFRHSLHLLGKLLQRLEQSSNFRHRRCRLRKLTASLPCETPFEVRLWKCVFAGTRLSQT